MIYLSYNCMVGGEDIQHNPDCEIESIISRTML